MDWSNETYVRLYIRDTVTWKRLRWQGQTVLMHIIRKLDRSGVMDGVEDLVLDVSIMTGLPEDVVKTGIDALLREKTFVHNGASLIMPNFIEAQETPKSDKQRQRESRENRRRNASQIVRDVLQNVTNGAQSVTNCHDVTDGVTIQPVRSQSVTLNCALPCSTLPCSTKQKKTPKPPAGADLAFNAFWNAYGKKTGVDYARKCFQKAVKSGLPDSGTLVPIILMQKENRAKSEALGVFVPPWPNPSTWLNQGRWKDEIETITPHAPVAPQKTAEELRMDKFLEGVYDD